MKIPIISLVIVVVDELIKWFVLQTPSPVEFHKNTGLIFDIPIRMPIILFFSFLIGAVLVRLAWKHAKKHPEIASAASLIIIGALGNIYDRIAYGFTVDYILIGRSAINLSDLVILSGVVWLILASRKIHNNEKLTV